MFEKLSHRGLKNAKPHFDKNILKLKFKKIFLNDVDFDNCYI